MDVKEAFKRATDVAARNIAEKGLPRDGRAQKQRSRAEALKALVASPGWQIIKDQFSSKIMELSHDIFVDDTRSSREVITDLRQRKTLAQAYIDIINFAEEISNLVPHGGKDGE